MKIYSDNNSVQHFNRILASKINLNFLRASQLAVDDLHAKLDFLIIRELNCWKVKQQKPTARFKSAEEKGLKLHY